MPKPEFCIATSIATVFFTSIGNLKKLAIKKPKKRPIKLCRATAIRIFQERLIKLSIFIEKIIPMINAIEISENKGKNFNKVFSLFLIEILISTPNKTGRKTIKNVDLIKLSISISIFSSANKKIKAGVKKTAKPVDTKVQKIDNDKFALQIYAITFEAVPPGHEPKIIKPRAISFGKSKMKTKRNAKKGIIENCKMIVVNSHLGSVRIFLISCS